MMKTGLKLVLSATVAATVLAACGGGSSGTASSLTAANDLTVPINAANAASILGQAFTFGSGVTDFGTAASTTVTLNAAPVGQGFTIDSGGFRANGTMSYGSCIFTRTSSTFPAGPLSGLGAITIANCSYLLSIKGRLFTGVSFDAPAVWSLGTNKSTARTLSAVIVAPNGDVTVSGTKVGTSVATTGAGS